MKMPATDFMGITNAQALSLLPQLETICEAVQLVASEDEVEITPSQKQDAIICLQSTAAQLRAIAAHSRAL